VSGEVLFNAPKAIARPVVVTAAFRGIQDEKADFI
jgi:hypothetical protein